MPNTAIETSPLTTEADRALAAALIGLPSVRAVSLGGSRALGLADATSDTDLYAWFEAPLDAPALRQAAIAGLADGGAVALFDQFGPEDKFAIDGRLVEIVYLDLADINASIEAARPSGSMGRSAPRRSCTPPPAASLWPIQTAPWRGCATPFRRTPRPRERPSSPTCRRWPKSSEASSAAHSVGGTCSWWRAAVPRSSTWWPA